MIQYKQLSNLTAQLNKLDEHQRQEAINQQLIANPAIWLTIVNVLINLLTFGQKHYFDADGNFVKIKWHSFILNSQIRNDLLKIVLSVFGIFNIK